MSLILELPENLEQQLRDAAEKTQTSPEAFAVSMLEKALSPSDNGELLEHDQQEDDKHRQRVREIGEYVERKNAELYRRLA